MLNKQFTIKQVCTSVYRYIIPRIPGMLVALLFMVVVMASVLGTTWPTIDQLPQNLDDQSNIKGIGLLLFTQFAVPFELIGLVLLATLIGAVYVAHGEDEEAGK